MLAQHSFWRKAKQIINNNNQENLFRFQNISDLNYEQFDYLISFCKKQIVAAVQNNDENSLHNHIMALNALINNSGYSDYGVDGLNLFVDLTTGNIFRLSPNLLNFLLKTLRHCLMIEILTRKSTPDQKTLNHISSVITSIRSQVTLTDTLSTELNIIEAVKRYTF